MSCVREASPPLPDDHLRHDIKKRRFLQPLRGLRRIFRRKGRPAVSAASEDGCVDAVTALRCKEPYDPCEAAVEATNLEPAKSNSTSQLTDDQIDNSQRRSLQSTLLSVSHDSVFTSEQRSPDSGSETSLCVHTRLGFPHSSVRAELFEAVRRRRVREANTSDDEDLGLPRSPISSSPTTADDMFTKENIVTKSSQSTCSDGSLLSMGSSEIDEESYFQSSRHSSKLSLYEKRTSTGSDIQHNNRSTNSLNGDSSSLSHSAAKHKMAVKPKRNHGAPHKKRQLVTSNTLPTTPEVNEENSLKIGPPVKEKPPVADLRHSDEHQTNQNHGKSRPSEHHTSVTQINSSDRSTATQSKCVSLTNGVSISPVPSFKLLTSRSSAAASQLNTPIYDDVAADEEDAVNFAKREEGPSFFSRLLLRRSSKKKKATVEDAENARDADENDDDEETSTPHCNNASDDPSSLKDELSSLAYINGGLTNAMKHHPMFRQRVEPLNLLPAEVQGRTKVSYSSTVPVNMGDNVDVATTIVNGKRSLQKSQSFRNNDKLPYIFCEDTTPSLPVNIGLVLKETHGVVKRSSKSDEATNEFAAYEPVNFTESNKWKVVTPKVSEYNNVSVVNTLNINVNNDQTEPSSPVANEGNTKPKPIQVPVPAPRPSLLKRTPSTAARPVENDEKVSSSESINVTITEVDDGQKSIISISSRPSIASEADVNEISTSCIASDAADVNDSNFSASKIDEDLDDVFLPVVESMGVESLSDECSVLNSNATYEAGEEATPGIATEFPELKESGSTLSTCELLKEPSSTSPDISKPPILSTKPCDLKTDRVRPKSLGCKQDVDLPKKPVIVLDPNSNTVKVNDTAVVMRKKTRETNRVKDEEPELMKVFARRSLKLKETDTVEEMLSEVAKSRDSDKENEDSNSLLEERVRKKDESEVPSKPPFVKFQRSVSHDLVLTSNAVEKRQRCKSTPYDMEKCEQTSATPVREPVPIPEEKTSIAPSFKRIQQRREEWEKRAQQAMKVHETK